MYGTIVDWASYASDRGMNSPEITDTDLPALVRASDYIKYHYVANFRPQYDETVSEVELATYEAAFLERSTPGFFTKNYTPAEKKMLVQVDALRWEKVSTRKTDEIDNNQLVPISTKVEMYLRRYLIMNNQIGIASIGPTLAS